MSDSNTVRRELRTRIAAILRNTSSAAVDFYLRGTRLNGVHLRQVADAVEGREVNGTRLYPIQVIVNPAVRRHNHYDAMYHSGPNVFTFASDTIANDHAEALVVHEAVHASFDMRRIRLPQVDNEAAAYLAQAVYYLNKGNPVTSTPSAIFTAAYQLAQSVRRGFERVGDSAAQPLRNAILRASNYAHIQGRTSQGNGAAL